MAPENEAQQALKEIDDWITSAPSPSSFTNNNEMMKFIVEEVMTRVQWLLSIGVVLAPDAQVAKRGYTKNRAIVVGHLVRLTKLYSGFSFHTAKRQLELAGVFVRLIYETEARFHYFLHARNKKRAFRSYILASYRAVRASLIDLRSKAIARPLTPFERRMRRKMMKNLRDDGISFKELEANREWNIDGHDFRSMLKTLGREWEYSYGFGSASRWVHGGWQELKFYHLQREGRYYTPNLKFGDVGADITCPITVLTLDVLLIYLDWARVDRGGAVTPVVRRMLKLVLALDDEHERLVVAKR